MSIALKIKIPTFLKQDLRQASQLSEAHKFFVGMGQSYELDKYSATSQNHYRVTLKHAVGGYQTWLVFADHVVIDDPDHKDIYLKVPYYSQRDNVEDYWRTCNTSSHAMLLEYLKPGSINRSDDFYYQKHVKPYGDSTDWNIHTNALKRFQIESVFSQNLDFDDLDRSLNKGFPVVIGVLHRGTIDNPSGGHCLIVIGKNAQGYICHDPWGYGFSYNDHNGKDVIYPAYPSLQARWLADGPNSGYGRLIKSVDGKATGI